MTETGTLQWEIDQLVKTKLFSDEQAVVRSALRAQGFPQKSGHRDKRKWCIIPLPEGN
jgi:hypothetical protein